MSSVHVDITNDYSYFINDIYGRVQGFELTIRKWRTGNSPVSGMLSYTYSIAKGKGSSRNLGYLTYYRQQPEVTESHPARLGSAARCLWNVGHSTALRQCYQPDWSVRQRFALHAESEGTD